MVRGVFEPPVRRPPNANPDVLFWSGYERYWQGRYREALEFLDAAVAVHAQDARYWYFTALARRALGDDRQAVEAARQAAALRRQNLPGPDVVGTALERVQGPDRQFLNAAGR
jgi:tetratricopeptide (TPR) repeat protein